MADSTDVKTRLPTRVDLSYHAQAVVQTATAWLIDQGLEGHDLPDVVCDVIVLADGDDPGEAAAQACAWRWKREGRRVRIARPPRGLDFNDLLLGRALRIGEGAA